ncbi:MAG: hypothetical protein AAF614_26905 [Chloroflexota bacterium]
MSKLHYRIISSLILLLLAACQQSFTSSTEESLPTTVPTNPTPTVAATVVLANPTLPPADAPAPTTTPLPQPTQSAIVLESEPEEAETAIISPQQATYNQLRQSTPPDRDDTSLAIAYLGLPAPPDTTIPLVTEPLTVGTQQTFRIPNVDSNTISEINANLLWVSQHGYFWFDSGAGSVSPPIGQLEAAGQTFDKVYEQVIGFFGSENNPGIDGDPRVHIVNASPLALCDVTLATANSCRLSGLVNAADLKPAAVARNSNEREMFVMNASLFGTASYLSVLGHEFRHMIEDNYDPGDADWAVEGSASLAQDLIDLPGGTLSRANQFLQNPDQQLNSWPDSGTGTHYGQGYLFNRYLFEQLGSELYYQFAIDPAYGLRAIDSIAQANGRNFTGESLWLDWLVSLAAHQIEGAPTIYRYLDLELNTAAFTPISTIPQTFNTTVHQYAADYYQLPANQSATIRFTGNPTASLLGTPAFAGDFMWAAQRANYSNPRLTHSFDLSNVADATLAYAVYVDTEPGYDFAYVSISVDNGRSWRGLESTRMQGLSDTDDPANAALTERFYTGRQRSWIQEFIDLTPYVGQEVLIRFEYVTDPIKTFGGFAIDNISIPEIGFFDDVESSVGNWQAEGFIRATARMPQPWHLQLLAFAEHGLEVVRVPVGEDGTAVFTLNPQTIPPTLIVAATAPETLEVADYVLTIE